MDNCILNKGVIAKKGKIAKYFPKFYKQNKQLVDDNTIILIEDNWTEVEILLNKQTLECRFIDYRN